MKKMNQKRIDELKLESEKLKREVHQRLDMRNQFRFINELIP